MTKIPAAFQRELEQLINKHGVDAELITPDYILADFCVTLLKGFGGATRDRINSGYGMDRQRVLDARAARTGMIGDAPSLIPKEPTGKNEEGNEIIYLEYGDLSEAAQKHVGLRWPHIDVEEINRRFANLNIRIEDAAKIGKTFILGEGSEELTVIDNDTKATTGAPGASVTGDVRRDRASTDTSTPVTHTEPTSEDASHKPQGTKAGEKSEGDPTQPPVETKQE